MRRAVPILLALIVGGAFVYGLLTSGATRPASEAELAGRVRAARPNWSNYTEDLKAYLGATPVAQWTGEPVEASVDGNRVSVTFRLAPPWSGYAFGMPLLLRDPMGRIHANRDFQRQNGAGAYTFVLDNLDPATPLPWVEIRFPSDRQKRLVFDAHGTWTPAATP